MTPPRRKAVRATLEFVLTSACWGVIVSAAAPALAGWQQALVAVSCAALVSLWAWSM